MAGIPAEIDTALVALGRQSGLSSVLRTCEKVLDRAVSAAFAQSPPQPADADEAHKLLRECLDLARAGSAEVGDRAELPQLERLARLFEAHRAPARALTPAPPAPRPSSWATTAPGSTLPPAAATTPAGRPAIPRRAPIAPKKETPTQPLPPPKPFATIPRRHRTTEIVGSVLEKLADLYTWRQHLLANPLAAWREFRTMDSQLRAAIWSVGWLQDTVVEPAKELFAAAEDDAGKFAAAMALLYAGRQDTLLPLLFAPSASAPSDGALTALRMGSDVSLLEQVEGSIATAGAGMRVWLMSTAGDRGRLSADVLLGLIQDPNDQVACRAAELLAWVGRSQADARTIEGLLRPDDPPARQSSFLYAAVALGSTRALHELRRMLDAGAAVTSAAVDALAAAGSAADSERLLGLAARDEALAPVAVLAAGHLGNPIASGGAPPRRLLGGKPWTLAAAMARLGDPGEIARARQWHALELTVRTGLQPNGVLDPTARVHTQDAAVARLRKRFEERPRVLPEGGWFYGGQPVG